MKFLIYLLVLLTCEASFGADRTSLITKGDGSHISKNYVKNGSFDKSITKNITAVMAGGTSASKALFYQAVANGPSGNAILIGCETNTTVGIETCLSEFTLELEQIDKALNNNMCAIEYYVDLNTSSGGFVNSSYIEYTVDGTPYTQELELNGSFHQKMQFVVPCGTSTSTRSIVFKVNASNFFSDEGIRSFIIDEVHFGAMRVGYTVTNYTTGSGTYTVPDGVVRLEILMCGAGGGGAGSGTANGTAAGTGGTTEFGTADALGGAGGTRLGGGLGGLSSGTLYDIVINTAGGRGHGGGVNPTTANGTQMAGGSGGASFFGGGGFSGAGGSGTEGIAKCSGGGGGGNDNVGTSQSGGGGGAGNFQHFYIHGVKNSYSYAVGAAGTAGGAGTSGRAGGAGAPGYIVIKEYYR